MARKVYGSSTVLRKNEKGFVVASALLLIGVVLGSLVFIFFFQSVVRKNLNIKSDCLALNFKFQANQKKRIEELFSLNPRARALRRDYERAKTRLHQALMTGTPPVIAAARAQLLFVELQRLTLDQKQRAILSQARFDEASFRDQLNRLVRSRFRRPAFVEVGIGALAVNADRPQDMAPLYSLKNNFSKTQQSQAIWKTTFENYLLVPNFFLKQKLVTLPLEKRWENSCAATIEKRRETFFVTISAVRSSSKF